jgi:hypothetical protein
MGSPLLQRGVDRGELGIQVRTKAIDRNNNRNRNSRCDQSVFNGGSAGFVGKELCKNPLQGMPPAVCVEIYQRRIIFKGLRRGKFQLLIFQERGNGERLPHAIHKLLEI